MAKSREKYYQIDCRTAGEEADKVILGADAEQADEAIELGVEAVLVAGGEEANEVILVAVFRPREFFESRPQQTLEGV